MATKINSKTTLKAIKVMAQSDFGVELTNAQAKEIKSSVQDGCAVWTAERYITTRGSDDVNRMSASGVQYSAYKTFYKKNEWNQALATLAKRTDMKHITRQEAANRLHISVGRITQLYDAGTLKGYRVGEGRRCQLFITEDSVQMRVDNPVKAGNPKLKQRKDADHKAKVK